MKKLVLLMLMFGVKSFAITATGVDQLGKRCGITYQTDNVSVSVSEMISSNTSKVSGQQYKHLSFLSENSTVWIQGPELSAFVYVINKTTDLFPLEQSRKVIQCLNSAGIGNDPTYGAQFKFSCLSPLYRMAQSGWFAMYFSAKTNKLLAFSYPDFGIFSERDGGWCIIRNQLED